ncbi:aminoglycoside phosphotransferase family protein [Salinibacillus kushneri]|uniref:aminoglycoside phosphotransferase family protein n=1 Tax=Salinibacillus kushneri TaxID=237682 RepID=UPI0015A53BAB|nr:aminoglycoside phosphotransferase family protein [Salinibacillus kushneri]
MPLPAQFIKSVQFHFGEIGEKWLKQLPELIGYCEQKWNVKIEEPISLSINYVAPAVMQDGSSVFIKISIPGEEFRNEIKALDLFRTRKMVKPIDYDLKCGILLLKKLVPGDSLAELSNDELRTQIAAEVHNSLTYPSQNQITLLPTTKSREGQLRKILQTNPNGIGPYSRSILQKALSLFAYLNETAKQNWILHGDFHHENILRDKGGWVAIDPKGLIGEREYDFIQFLLNQLPKENVEQTINKRIEILAEQCQLAKHRLIKWGFCHSVLATCQTSDDKNHYNEDFYQGSKAFFHLCKQIDAFGATNF